MVERLSANIKLNVHKALIRPKLLTLAPPGNLLQTVTFEIAALAKQGFAQHWPLSTAHTDPQFTCGLHDFVCVFRYTKLFRQQA
jgi:hypothetical protein